MNLTSGGPIPASRYALIARALYKITLAFIYHDRGPEEAFATKYDELRKVILDEQASRHWLATPKDNPHHDQLSFSYQPLLLSDARSGLDQLRHLRGDLHDRDAHSWRTGTS
jgi:hypothetical protein